MKPFGVQFASAVLQPSDYTPLKIYPLPWVESSHGRRVMFLMLAVSLLLNAIIAVGNWQLYARVHKLEVAISSK